MRQDHTTSIKDFSWTLQSLIANFIKRDRATIALNMKAEGFRTSQIARIMFGHADKQTISKVCKLLKEVK